MSDVENSFSIDQALSPTRSASSRLPSGFRVVHVPVPESIFNHAKAQAYLSGLRFAVFVAKVLADAGPYPSNRTQQPLNDSADLQSVKACVSQP